MEKEKPVSIIIVNWNRKRALATCLSSLKNETAYSNYRVIVVDNGSADGSVDLVRESFPWADIIALDKNYGFAIGNNKGIAYALAKYRPEYILLLNNDTEIIQSEWLSKMVALADAENSVGIVGCKLVYPDGKTQYLGTKITVKGLTWIRPAEEAILPEVFDIDAVLGACFLIKRAVIDKIGYLDAGFSPFVHEESDFCARAKKGGYRTVMTLNVRVVHYWRASIDKVNSFYVDGIVRKNAIRFMLLNFPTSWLLKRAQIEIRIFIGCFFAKRKGKGTVPVKFRTERELLDRLSININGWLSNLRSLKEILAKRSDRTAKITSMD